MNGTKYQIILGAIALGLILSLITFGQKRLTELERTEKRNVAMRAYYEGQKLGLIESDESKRNAISKYETAISLFREIQELNSAAVLYIDVGRLYGNIGALDKAVASYNEAGTIYRNLGNLSGQATSINHIGWLYRFVGEKTKALEFYFQALPLYEAINQEDGKAVTLHSIGAVYIDLGDSKSALIYLQKAFDLRRKLKDDFSAAFTVYEMGRAYKELGQREKSISYYKTALETFYNYDGPGFINDALNEIGKSYSELGNKIEAVNNFNQALFFAQKTLELNNKARTYQNLMEVWDSLSKPELAIIYGKQAVKFYQEFRAKIKNLDRELQKSYAKSVTLTYRKLADILISKGRFPEAQAVLDLLKEQEYEQLTRSGETAGTVPYSQAEADVIAKIENLVALERERTELQKLLSTNGELSVEQNNKLAQLNLDIAAANKAFDIALDALGKAEASAATRVDEIKGGKVLQSALTELSEKTNSGVVALYTVLGTEEEKDAGGKPMKDKLKSKFGWVIMVTENHYTAYPIDVENLEETVFQFRAALSSDKYNPQPLAEKIYNAIFRQTSPKLKKTLEQDLQDYLKSHTDKTLMWSLDGVLRYIPMAALHDGKQYLVENYRNTVFTKESFVWLMNEYHADWKALGLGVSDKREGFSELPGVKTELETIVREPDKQTGILNGSIKLNDNFKKQTFFNIINAGGFPVIHISSHYSFDAGKPENSFLLAGDGNLTFAEIKQQQNLFKKVDLLTLSACDTGVSGNGKEAEGFAYLAQSLGAKSVIASLWKVSDAGTPELMIRFYKLRSENPNLSKGEAFRRAQLSLLGSEVKDAVLQPTAKVETKVTTPNRKRTDVFDLSGKTIELPLFVKDKQKPFAHPHYWASFVLIGNWR